MGRIKIIKRKPFPRYWPFVRGIHWLLVDFSHKGQWHRAVMLSLIYAWTNGWAIMMSLQCTTSNLHNLCWISIKKCLHVKHAIRKYIFVKVIQHKNSRPEFGLAVYVRNIFQHAQFFDDVTHIGKQSFGTGIIYINNCLLSSTGCNRKYVNISIPSFPLGMWDYTHI